jgi:hypothetical protein
MLRPERGGHETARVHHTPRWRSDDRTDRTRAQQAGKLPVIGYGDIGQAPRARHGLYGNSNIRKMVRRPDLLNSAAAARLGRFHRLKLLGLFAAPEQPQSSKGSRAAA